MNKEKITVNTVTDILLCMPQRKHPFRALLDWIKAEKKLTQRQLAKQSGEFVPATLTEQLKKQNPNPGFDVIHGIARTAGISEQMVVDACLGRPFEKGQKLQDAILKEVLRKYQMLDSRHRTRALQGTIQTLSDLVDEALEDQSRGKGQSGSCGE